MAKGQRNQSSAAVPQMSHGSRQFEALQAGKARCVGCEVAEDAVPNASITSWKELPGGR